MFVWSIKTSKKEVAILIIGIIAFVAALVYVLWPTGSAETSALVSQGYSVKGSTEAERTQFLKQFGWDLKKDSAAESQEVTIPIEFTNVYVQYNQLQKQQGFDLEKYKGKKATRWIYKVSNYPGEKQNVYANLLICDGDVIGGDISSTEFDGFMHGFSLDKAGASETPATTQAVSEASTPETTAAPSN
ncbi:MAG: DUF4830 domain-containing protein [Oscillospiraceae bacterium]|jgi:type II secretory pathway pseudopilin PulG|nr:DUF4830 domain-containing protein [Oscillospiraceae bacterium]